MKPEPGHEPARLRAIVRGRVQGVNFRAYTAEHARRLGLTGFAHNLPDGQSVLVEAQGQRGALDALAARLREGPAHALVRDVQIEYPTPIEGETEFRVI
jgi:acylphosphatase